MISLKLLVTALLLLQHPIEGWSLKCHDCTNRINDKCSHIPSADDPLFLLECPPSSSMCVIQSGRGENGVQTLARYCAPPNWSCTAEFFSCTTNGCNYLNDTEVLQVQAQSGYVIQVTPMELIMVNIYGLGAIVMLSLVLVIWVISKCCGKIDENPTTDADSEVADLSFVDNLFVHLDIEENEDSMEEEWTEHEMENEAEEEEVPL